jgi:hypothetical protein
MSHRTWMQDSTEIHGTLLANICLPATHDSGTYALRDWLTHDAVGHVADIYNALETIANTIKSIPGIGSYLPNPMDWLIGQIYPAVKGLSCATRRSIRQQLNDGIRCVDLRIFYDRKKKLFYTWHGLVGESLDVILRDIANFLQSTSVAHGGEIVYVTVGHYMDSNGKKEVPYKDLAQLLVENLESYMFRPAYSSGDASAGPDNDPFQQTYQQIIDAVGTSAAIVAYDKGARLDDYCGYFWPGSYSPPDGGASLSNKGGIYGSYDNTESVSDMLRDQTEKLQQAVANDKPFALYMTLTGSPLMWTSVVIGAVAKGIIKKGEAISSRNPIVGEALEQVGEYLERTAPPQIDTLADLAKKVDRDLTRLVVDNFVSIAGRNPNRISMIYCDFYETTRVVELAIRLSGTRTLDWVGDHKIVFKNTPLADSSSESVALAAYDRNIVCAYISDNTLYQAVAWYFDDYSVWYGGTPISIAAQNLQSWAQPALASFRDTLVLAYMTTSSDSSSTSTLNLAQYDGTSWTGGEPIAIDGNPVQPFTPAALIEFRGVLYLIYRGSGMDMQIHVATSDDAVNWSGGSGIVISKENIPLTNSNITAAIHDDTLYIFYRGASSGAPLYYATFDGTQWSGNSPIDAVQATTAPAAASVEGVLWLVYKDGNSSDLAAVVLQDGTWTSASLAPLSPNSGVNPALIHHAEGLRMVYPGNSGALYSAAYLPNAPMWSGADPVVNSSSAIGMAPAAATMINEGLSPAVEELWMTYSNALTLSCTTAPDGAWTAGGTLSHDVQASFAPAMTTYNNAWVAAFILAGSGDGDRVVCDFCTGPEIYTYPLDLGQACTTAPAVASYEKLLYLAVAGSGGTIYTATFDSQTKQWSAPQSVASQPGGVSAQSSIRPALATHGALLYLCWLNEGNQLCIATFDGQRWSGGTAISALNTAINPRSSDAPAMVSYGGRLWLFYKGASTTNNNLYVTWHDDDQWVGDVQLQSITNGLATQSVYGPAAVAFEDALCLLYVDPSNEAIDLALYERSLATARRRTRSNAKPLRAPVRR